MKSIWCLSVAIVLFAAPVAAQKKTSPYLDCKKNGGSEQQCVQFMDPHLRKARENREATAQKQMESLNRSVKQDEEWRRRMQSGR